MTARPSHSALHAGSSSIWLTPEHEMLRDQVSRFVAEEIKPHADAWEQAGFVPRDVLRRMGALGFFGIRYPAEYGGSDMDVLATVVFAEELGRSTYSGVAITALVHTDMASVHVANAGSAAQKARWMPGIVAGDVITAVAVTEPDAGSDVKGIRTTATRVAVVRMPFTSDPASGSVTATAVMTSPATMPGIHFAFCAALPAFAT